MAGPKDWLFHNSPLGIKGGLLGLHSCLQARHKYGSTYRAEVAELRTRAMLDGEELRGAQRELLAGFLKRVAEVNSHYRAMMKRNGIDATFIDRDPQGALLAMDLLEKPFLKANLAVIASEGVRTFTVFNTSGTSGSPMDVPVDLDGYQRGFAYWRRFYDGMGLGESFRNARFSGRVLLGRQSDPDVFWVNDWYERRLFFSTYHMTEANLPAYVARLNDYRPDLIDGYPSALAILARFMERRGLRFTFVPRAAACTAETLLEEDRTIIERVFGCRLHNQYASSEGAPFITECSAGKMHLNTDTGYFEFSDVPGTDESMELIVTSFRNLKLPLIRYRIGDMVRPSGAETSPCVCGSAFPTVAAIEGRVDDLLYSTERGAVGRLDPIFKGVGGISRSQIRQEGRDAFRILVVPDARFNESTLEILERNFRSRLGQSVRLLIEKVDEIPLTANGKFRAVVNAWRNTSSLKDL